MKRNIGYDLIRIFAFLGVLLVHLSFYVELPNTLERLFSFGARGVQIFFCLSAFLAALTYSKYSTNLNYYWNRIKKIMPPYYMTLIIVIIFHTFFYKDVVNDNFGLGWLRYFLGLNTAFPTNDFKIWSNINNFWTMGVVLNFYLFFPFFMKYFNSFNKSVILFVLAFLFRALYSSFITFMVPYVEGLDVSFVSWSFFGISYQFILGIIAYWSTLNKNQFKGITFFVVIIFMGILLDKEAIIWGSLTSILLIAFSNLDLSFINGNLRKRIILISNFSFIIYLVHGFCYDLAYDFLNDYLLINNGILWAIITFLLISTFTFIVKKSADYLTRFINMIETEGIKR